MKTMTSATGATPPVRLVQSRRREGDLLLLRVDVEGVEAPKLTAVTTAKGITLRGALLPRRCYALHGEWFVLTIRQTDDGVAVDLGMRAAAAECGFVLTMAWAALLTQDITVDAPWWAAVAACEWREAQAWLDARAEREREPACPNCLDCPDSDCSECCDPDGGVA